MNLDNKKAIVFGGTSGIGLAAACQLRDKSANVTVVAATSLFRNTSMLPLWIRRMSWNVSALKSAVAIFRAHDHEAGHAAKRTELPRCVEARESRGAHHRLDAPERDDANFLCHSRIQLGEQA